jgi:adenosylhomocysteine nucleosidase
MKIGIVCGFKAEARLARRITPLVALGWKNPQAAQSLIDRGATALLSFGVCGGLSPDVKAGDCFAPRSVLFPDGREILCDTEMQNGFVAAHPHAWQGPAYAADGVIATVAEKDRLFKETGAIAADMESGQVALAASEAHIPFAVFRAVSDAADTALPPAALAGLTDSGGVNYTGVLLSLLRQPGQWSALMQTRRDTDAALKALWR